MAYFYCYYCKKTDADFKDINKQIITWKNMRGGYGHPITHFVCPYCKYVLAGIMYGVPIGEEEFARLTIELYSIRDSSEFTLQYIKEELEKRFGKEKLLEFNFGI